MSATFRATRFVLIGCLLTTIVFFFTSNGWRVFQVRDDCIECLMNQMHILKFDEKLTQFYRYQSAERQKVLSSFLDPKTASAKFGLFYNALVAEIVCPWLARVGNVNDGGKWTCNPWALPDNCIIYSLGVGRDVTFEFEMDQVAEQRCKIYSFDPNPKLGQRIVDKKSERFVFNPVRIANRTNDTMGEKSIEDIMKYYEHKFIDFLKIDIEGTELSILPLLLRRANDPIACQILIEMHGTPAQCATLHSRLGKAGYCMFFYELNGFYPNFTEYSFMHESCFARYGVRNLLARNFPS